MLDDCISVKYGVHGFSADNLYWINPIEDIGERHFPYSARERSTRFKASQIAFIESQADYLINDRVLCLNGGIESQDLPSLSL